MSVKQEGDWRPPKPSDLGGPEQLGDVMIDFRHWHASKGLHSNADISDQNLRKLIKLAYFASQTADEGRFPRFRLFAPTASGRSVLDEMRILTFREPRPLQDVNSIRRLAPLVSSHDRALLIVEGPQGLVCEGLVSIVRPTHLGPPQQGLSLRPDGLMVRVDGPGSLQVTEAGLTFVLRAGTVQNLSSFHLIEPLREWFSAMADEIVARCAALDVDGERHYVASRTSLRMLITAVWSEVLLTTLNLRHGGAFIVVPDPAQAPLSRSIQINNLHLGAEIEAYWKSRMLVEQQQQKGDIERALQVCHRQWHRLITRGHALAHLSAVDGCVVLNRDLNVDGFGAVIHVDSAQLEQTRSPDLDYWTHEAVRSGDGIGTRHHSARNLCQAQPGAFAFVISQDGDLTLFFSDQQGVYRAVLLSPADGTDW